ncbi:hypothetical protein V1498_12815 [Peribacillus sp. SCS-26]|uniref:hypothetical protein n=1 Tax=Paraperibacillus marinus TaxID=3115295 RepID=UPI0039063236
MADIPSTTVSELAEFIRVNPETRSTERQLLGMKYKFYRLDVLPYSFYMETAGNRIVQLDGMNEGEPAIAYRSYKDSRDFHTPIRIP